MSQHNALTSGSRKRIYVACTQCRQRKIRCVTSSNLEFPDTPCERCAKKGLQCEYLSVGEQDAPPPTAPARDRSSSHPARSHTPAPRPPESWRPSVGTYPGTGPSQQGHLPQRPPSRYSHSHSHSNIGLYPQNVMPSSSAQFNQPSYSSRTQYPAQYGIEGMVPQAPEFYSASGAYPMSGQATLVTGHYGSEQNQYTNDPNFANFNYDPNTYTGPCICPPGPCYCGGMR